ALGGAHPQGGDRSSAARRGVGSVHHRAVLHRGCGPGTGWVARRYGCARRGILCARAVTRGWFVPLVGPPHAPISRARLDRRLDRGRAASRSDRQRRLGTPLPPRSGAVRTAPLLWLPALASLWVTTAIGAESADRLKEV